MHMGWEEKNFHSFAAEARKTRNEQNVVRQGADVDVLWFTTKENISASLRHKAISQKLSADKLWKLNSHWKDTGANMGKLQTYPW